MDQACRWPRTVLTTIIAFSAVSRASAADDIEQRLLERIDTLERKIAVLESRVESLERQARETAPGEPAAELPARIFPAQWRDPRNWEHLKARMTEGEVEAILGQPDRTRSVGKFEYWYYGEYKVVFYLGRLDSWLTP